MLATARNKRKLAGTNHVMPKSRLEKNKLARRVTGKLPLKNLKMKMNYVKL